MPSSVARVRSAIVLGMAVITSALVAACSTGASSLSPGANAPSCQSFAGETVDALAWSSGGDFVAVDTSSIADGRGRIRVFGWPEMKVVSDVLADVDAADHAPIDDHGAVYWFTEDPFSNEAASTRLWKLDPGGTPTMVGGAVRDGAYVGLIWAGGALISMEYDPGPPERSRLAKIDVAHPEAAPVGLTAWTERLWSSFWADRSGDWLVWDDFDGAGEPQDFVVLHGGQRQVVRPPGYGGRQITLSPDHESLLYQRSETARLTVLNLKSGQVGRELSAIEFFGGEVSSTGMLAGLTAHGPGESNELCFLDVAAQL